jgi:hypothetical protein
VWDGGCACGSGCEAAAGDGRCGGSADCDCHSGGDGACAGDCDSDGGGSTGDSSGDGTAGRNSELAAAARKPCPEPRGVCCVAATSIAAAGVLWAGGPFADLASGELAGLSATNTTGGGGAARACTSSCTACPGVGTSAGSGVWKAGTNSPWVALTADGVLAMLGTGGASNGARA